MHNALDCNLHVQIKKSAIKAPWSQNAASHMLLELQAGRGLVMGSPGGASAKCVPLFSASCHVLS
eukprot:6175046-Pleurochrysis_carterae.AAC.1